KLSYIEGVDGDEVCIDGVVFTSRVLSANLGKLGRVFAYVATCGREFDEVEIAADDLLKGYWLDTIKGMALFAVMEYLYSHIRGKFLLETTATMSPGEAERDIWPIEQQKLLFSLFGNTEELVGVKLTESMLMIPNKSLSGICFPSEISFKSCQVCQREDCHARRAAFDKGLMESYRGDVERD
ncbi:MAG: vitamin B12 dependent-methionine synthase activation domain-containing protein, partial [Planctomycetota bacterium]